MPDTETVLAALTASHDRLKQTVERLDADQIAGPAYPSEWSVAQALSHLGSGAEIFSLFLAAGTTGAAAPEFSAFQGVWDVWNAKAPQAQATDALVSDQRLLDEAGALTAEERQSFSVPMFGEDRDLGGVLQMRLGEHTLHTWDVVVTQDPAAGLSPEAVPLVLDQLGALVARTGRKTGDDLHLAVHTTDPERQLRLDVDDDGARLSDLGADAPPASITLPAEAFVRLVYGRLDPDHTPPLEASGVDLDQLRQTFPGF